MAVPQASQALLHFVDDEMLRAPLLFDQVIESDPLDHPATPTASAWAAAQRPAMASLLQRLQAHQSHLADYFLRSLREQVERRTAARRSPQRRRSTARHSPRHWRSWSTTTRWRWTSSCRTPIECHQERGRVRTARVADLHVGARRRPRRRARPQPASAPRPSRARSGPRPRRCRCRAGTRSAFMRHAGQVLAQLLRKSLRRRHARGWKQQGVEPAAYRTVILPSRLAARPARRDHRPSSRPAAHAGSDAGARRNTASQLRRPGAARTAPRTGQQQCTPRHEPRRPAGGRTGERLFDAMMADERLAADIRLLISRLNGPVMRLTLRDDSLLDKVTHPLWRFINRLAFEAEMVPDPADPERVAVAQDGTGHRRSADERARARTPACTAGPWSVWTASWASAWYAGSRPPAATSAPCTSSKTRSAPGKPRRRRCTARSTCAQLDTVPAVLLADPQRAPAAPSDGQAWLVQLQPGDWVRMFLQGRWVQAQLLWPGERQEVWLFGDGASDATWAVRRGALLLMHEQALAQDTPPALDRRVCGGQGAGATADRCRRPA